MEVSKAISIERAPLGLYRPRQIDLGTNVDKKKVLLFYKQGCSDLFEHLTIPSGVCSPPIPHAPGYYRKKFYRGSPKWVQVPTTVFWI